MPRFKHLFKYHIAVVALLALASISLTESALAVDIEAMKAAADRGDIAAQYDLSGAYYTGNGVPMDRRKAVRKIEALAKQGYAPAQYTLGRFYDVNGYFQENQPVASRWYKLSAVQGFADAQAILGFQYFHGYGLDKDWEQSARWLSLAANQGNPDAIKNLEILKEKVRKLAASEQRLKNIILKTIIEYSIKK